jgi:hypothetical protein
MGLDTSLGEIAVFNEINSGSGTLPRTRIPIKTISGVLELENIV